MSLYEAGYFLYNLGIDSGNLYVPKDYIPEDALVPYIERRPFRGRKTGRVITKYTMRHPREYGKAQALARAPPGQVQGPTRGGVSLAYYKNYRNPTSDAYEFHGPETHHDRITRRNLRATSARPRLHTETQPPPEEAKVTTSIRVSNNVVKKPTLTLYEKPKYNLGYPGIRSNPELADRMAHFIDVNYSNEYRDHPVDYSKLRSKFRSVAERNEQCKRLLDKYVDKDDSGAYLPSEDVETAIQRKYNEMSESVRI